MFYIAGRRGDEFGFGAGENGGFCVDQIVVQNTGGTTIGPELILSIPLQTTHS